jgi:DNA-binding CsgD family transcriptional regulator
MLYGRDAERDRIGELLDAARQSRSGALVLRGEPGIGKTALLLDTRERAADMHVLSARGVESEAELPFAALHQLLRPALGELEGLPAPQAGALRRALGLADGAAPERFLVFAGCLSLLSELAERRPVLCLVDDAHWLDEASADALRFVARRLGAEGIALLFGAREGDVRRFEASDVPSLVLAGLDADAAGDLARGAGVAAAQPVLDRLVERTGGNALALLELPTVLSPGQLAGAEPLPEQLPLTGEVERVFLARVRHLPDGAQRLLLVAAADDTERVAVVVDAAGGLGVAADALDAAEGAGLVSVAGRRLAFRHPLVRSAVLGAAPSSERREAHRALAEALSGDPEGADRRAWHLAASALVADEEAVRALEAAAERAGDRAGHAAAARALERAAELTADGPARGRRLTGAARAASLAGADERAAALAAQARPLVDDPLELAALALVAGIADRRRGRPADAIAPLLEAAGRVAEAAPGRALELLLHAAAAGSEAWEPGGSLEACRLASAIVPEPGDEGAAMIRRVLVGWEAMAEGESARAAEHLEAAVAWAATAEDEQLVFWGSVGAILLGDDRAWGALINRAIALARERGALGILAESLSVRSLQLLLAQRFDEAAASAAEGADLARELGAQNFTTLPTNVLAAVAAIRGDEEEAARRAAQTVERATVHGLALQAAMASWALAHLDLGRGRWPEALERLEPMADVRPGRGDVLLAVVVLPDAIEAAVRAGRRERALAMLPAFEAWAEGSGAAWARPRLAGYRALLAEGDEATAHFEEALALAEDARPFDLARIRLLYGEHLRRERRRTAAREHLRAAVEAFERLGAAPWAERARAELRATGETARTRDPSAAVQLTPQERQVARFVAQGLSNKEVAAQLYLSPRTIDAHLRNAFAKLGVTSRTQLARMDLGDAA